MPPLSAIAPQVPTHRALGTPAIRRVRSALDPARVKEALCTEWRDVEREGWQIRDCAIIRLFDYGGGRFVISYMVDIDNGCDRRKLNLYGEIADTDPRPVAVAINQKLSKRRRRQIDPDSTGPVFALPSLQLVLRPFGLDEQIDGMRVVRQPNALTDHVAAVVDADPAKLSIKAFDLLTHRLGKRAVYRCRYKGCDSGPRSVILKLYKPGTAKARTAFDTLVALYRAGLDGRSGVRIPAALCHLDAWEGFLMEDAAGQMLVAGVSEASADRMTKTGAAIARMRSADAITRYSYGAADEVRLLAQWSDIVSLLEPKLGAQVLDLFARLRHELESLPAPDRALIHRDFHEKQVLVDGETTTLIDFDTIAMGDPAIDIGNFVAHLRWAAVQTGTSAEGAEISFLEGYCNVNGRNLPAHWPVYCHAALLRLVCLNAFSSQMKPFVPRLIDLLDRTGT